MSSAVNSLPRCWIAGGWWSVIRFWSRAEDQPNSRKREYKSRITFLGAPLVHVKFGMPEEGDKPAIGWIAAGDFAYGLLFAWGGFAVALISVGIVSVGIVSVGAVGLGLIAMEIVAFPYSMIFSGFETERRTEPSVNFSATE